MSGISSTLQSLASALGGRDPTEPGNPYVLGDDGLGCLRDIKRWLQLYDEKRDVWDVKTALASLNLVSADLCPILASWTLSDADNEHKRRICLACVEILVPLTWPMELDADADEYKIKQHPNLKLAQSTYKRAILFNPDQDILSSIMRVAFPSLSIPRRERTERDHGIIRLVLYLVRNLLSIDEARNRSDTILALHKSNALELICVMASGIGDEFVTEDVILLDMLFQLLRGINTSTIFDLSKAAPDTIKSDLSDLLSREKVLKTVSKSKAHTRHNRFGTMVSVVQDQRRFTIASQTAIISDPSANNFDGIEATKKWKKPLRQLKTHDDVDVSVTLNTEARRVIGEFVNTFLDAGFNPLFASLLKALEYDDTRVSQMNRVQYLYIQGWCFAALRESGKAASRMAQLGSDFKEDAEYSLVAAMMDSRATIMLRKMLRESFESKLWKETHAAMECFRELLLTIDNMSLSSNVEYQEIAENLQSNLYYEEANLELIVACVKYYTNQSFGYLNAATSLATVLLKMLEKFASTKTHMFVRARRQRQRKKTQNLGTNTANASDEEEAEAEAEAREAVKEKAFSFARFEAKFMNDHSIDAFLSLLEFYADLTPEQIKRVISFFHRVFVGHKLEILIFRLDLFDLLNRMIKDKANLSATNPVRKEVETFAEYMFKRFSRSLNDNPALAWEILFDKLSNDMFYLTHDTDRAPIIKGPGRIPAELEVKSGLSHADQIKVAVGVLLDNQKFEFLNWLTAELGSIFSRRSSWETEHLARLEFTATASADLPSAEVLKPVEEHLVSLLFKDGKVRLLLKVLGMERLGEREDVDATWIVPALLETDALRSDHLLLEKYIFEPPTFDDNKTATDFIRRQIVKRDSYNTDSSSSSSESDAEHIQRPRKRIRTEPRQRGPVDEEELEARRQKREEMEEQRKGQIKSAKYVDSDDSDDEAARAVFFAAEEALRQRQKLKSLGKVPSGTRPKRALRPTKRNRGKRTRLATGEMDSNKENRPAEGLFLPDVRTDDDDDDNEEEEDASPDNSTSVELEDYTGGRGSVSNGHNGPLNGAHRSIDAITLTSDEEEAGESLVIVPRRAVAKTMGTRVLSIDSDDES